MSLRQKHAADDEDVFHQKKGNSTRRLWTSHWGAATQMTVSPPSQTIAPLPPTQLSTSTTTTTTTTTAASVSTTANAAIALAASVESFYRSAMNHLVNEKVRGVTRLSDVNASFAALFPKMYIQVPTRVVFITSLKSIRAQLSGVDVERLWGLQPSSTVGQNASTFHLVSERTLPQRALVNTTQLFLYAMPGLVMAPLCSILEASNVPPCRRVSVGGSNRSAAGGNLPLSSPSQPHASASANSVVHDPLLTHRWRRGFGCRLVREAIFAIGLNEAADKCAASCASLQQQRMNVTKTTGHHGNAADNIVSKTDLMIDGRVSVTPFHAACGSVAAGIVAGYLSHVPHILSALRLMHPDKGYRELWRVLWGQRYEALTSSIGRGYCAAPSVASAGGVVEGGRLNMGNTFQKIIVQPLLKTESSRIKLAKFLSIVAPVGVIRRSVQISGTFVIINGLAYCFGKIL